MTLRKATALAALIAASILLGGCASSGSVSVGVGVAGPAPWGGPVAVPVAVGPGPSSGRYGHMW
jgi:hypothetical protein